MEPNREVLWNISTFGRWFIYLPMLLAMGSIGYGLYKRYKLWKIGQPLDRVSKPEQRALFTLESIFGHVQLLQNKLGGIFHALVFSGFLALFIGTCIVFFEADFGFRVLTGAFYVGFTIILNTFGLFCIVGILIALYRRFMLKLPYLEALKDDIYTPLWLLFILITGFIIQSARLGALNPEWAPYSYVGWMGAAILKGVGFQEHGLRMLHKVLWYIHMMAAFGFLAYFPYSKLFHILLGPANIFFKNNEHKGTLRTIENMEEAETFGVQHLHEFSWKDLLDIDACVRCGRCESQCPAHNTEKPLNPKNLIQTLKVHLDKVGPKLLDAIEKGIDLAEIEQEQIQGAVIDDEILWSCTTCRSCMYQCPVFVEHIQKIIDMRRYLVLMEARFPKEMNNVFKGLENNQNPWNLGSNKRMDWAKDLNLKLIGENPDVEYLYWVGCAGSFDDRNQKVAKSFVKIMDKAGINYGILGIEEGCCGDTARRSGNEYLAKILIDMNIEILNSHKVKKIITTCPHCFNSFNNEYPQFGAKYEVIHHTELISNLINSGKIKLNGKDKEAVLTTFHDSCYLGRYNEIYEKPRSALNAAGNVTLTEMEKNHDESFCCGAGGAKMWMEESGKRINRDRTEQAVRTGANQICTACPYCLTMLNDGIKDKELEETHKVRDIAEIVAEVME